MFKIREVSGEELIESMLYWCREEYFGRGLIDSTGLRVIPVPKVDDDDIDDDEWHESGLTNNSWRDRKVFGFSLLDDLTRRK